MRSFFTKFMPFFWLGVFIVVLIAGFIIVSSLLIYAAIIGVILFGIFWLKEKIWPSKSSRQNPFQSYQQQQRMKHEGRTFEHDERDS